MQSMNALTYSLSRARARLKQDAKLFWAASDKFLCNGCTINIICFSSYPFHLIVYDNKRFPANWAPNEPLGSKIQKLLKVPPMGVTVTATGSLNMCILTVLVFLTFTNI